MLIEHQILIIKEAHLVQQSTLATILFSGGLKSNMLLDPTLKLKIEYKSLAQATTDLHWVQTLKM